jgi:hypothetical protein
MRAEFRILLLVQIELSLPASARLIRWCRAADGLIGGVPLQRDRLIVGGSAKCAALAVMGHPSSLQ